MNYDLFYTCVSLQLLQSNEILFVFIHLAGRSLLILYASASFKAMFGTFFSDKI